VSAQDPRVVVDSTIGTTCDGGTWYYPIKFGNPSTYVPLATGVEARLMEAEAALQGSNIGAWAAALNGLRANAPGTYLQLAGAMNPLSTDSTTTANATLRVDVMFRERAFWLFGTGTRLGDLRRLIRQYGRNQSAVFPAGAYANGSNSHLPSPLPTYGTDVSLTLPLPSNGPNNTGGFTSNPNYRGCLSGPGTA
jgi:hypothetical protein